MNGVPYYLGLDTETGGLSTDVSLLSLYLKVTDRNFNKIADLQLWVKPNDGKFVVTAQALTINKIDLIQLDAKAIKESEAGTKLYDFLNEVTQEGKIKLTPLGQNVGFDIAFITQKLISKTNWDKFVSYRVMDTGTIGRFLIETGYVPDTVKGSLSTYGEFFGLDISGSHTAEGDVDLCFGVYQGMMNLISGNIK